MAYGKNTTLPGENQQETLFGPHQYSLFSAPKFNPYEERQRARKARYESRAEAAREQAFKDWEASASLRVDPADQPILVGHHSEKKHRNLLKRSDDKMRKSIENDKKAEYYEERARTVGKGGISSDDPQAIEKLASKLAEKEAKQDRMKAANRYLRANPNHRPGLVALGLPDNEIEDALSPYGRKPYGGFAAFSLDNNRADIKRLKERLNVLKRLAQVETVEVVKEGYTLRHDREENRVMFILDGKPSSEIRTILKKYAFKWSPRRGAWVRQATANGIFSARHARKELDALQG